MVSIDELINDEEEAIRKYAEYLKQGVPHNQLRKVHKILEDEKRHLRELKSLR
jgi:rubrerythrin